MYDVIINGEVRRAVSGLASKLWVPGRAGMHGRPLLSFCPITLLQLTFLAKPQSWGAAPRFVFFPPKFTSVCAGPPRPPPAPKTCKAP